MAERKTPTQEDRELQRLVEHRLDFALRLGFPLEDAELIASSSCDLHEIEGLIKKGCPVNVVLRIVL